MESREASSIPATIQVVHPLEQAISHPDKAKYTRTERRRPLLPDHMLLNSYLPPRGPAPSMEEVSVPGLEGAQEIIDRWRPFNQGESLADHLHDLYPVMLRMPVTIRAEGQGEEYTITVPTRTIKEDLQQMIEDGMQVRNRNFTQSTELVSLGALYLVPVLFLSYGHIINMILHRRLLLFGTWPSSTKNFKPSSRTRRGYSCMPSRSFPTKRH